MLNLVPNVDSIYNVSNKRAKHNLDSTFLWHCRLAHRSKKCIEKLQQDGLLKSTDKESFDQCVSCLMDIVSRQGASYFITFMDDYSHQEEEYISQEFKDYPKACGIVQQLTPPYTPQHNGVFERMNRTLLDMVRSMLNLTTLSLSFWDYALETAPRLLNMVLTKKVDKTPYELWYGKVHNLSYLKVWGCEKSVEGRENLKKFKMKIHHLLKTLEIPMKVKGFEPPQEEVVPVRRSARTHRAPERLCLNIKVEEHSLGDLNEPTNYKAAMLDPESDKWLDAMNAEMQSMKDNQFWHLVDLPPNCKTVGSKWFIRERLTWM
nr:hypothetical protein [Tanacetum cinerariifolium]